MVLEILMKKENLTPNEIQVADFILSNIDEFSELSLNELANLTFVSPPTITRLCKKVGCKNYSSFKVKVMEEYTVRNKMLKSIDLNYPFSKMDEKEDIIQNIADISISAIESAKNNFNYTVIDQVIHEIIKTHCIDIYASGMSAKVAGLFVEKMNRIGYNTNLILGSSSKKYRANSSTQHQFAMIVSYSGLTRSITDCVELLSHSRTKTFLITGNRLSPLVSKVNYVYYMEMDEDISIGNKIDGFAGLIMLHFILDSIYALLFARDYDKHLSISKDVNDKQFTR
ncbi:MurR/RpiR family transcriptional regulator [Floccifex sp.]|uniref:MurR/RpiR family transcriptional regulator n=1 Tax=Floccifex sp. TaxID=2815810 RepID=UPI003F043339